MHACVAVAVRDVDIAIRRDGAFGRRVGLAGLVDACFDGVGQFEHDKYGRLPASVLYTEHKHPGDPLKLKLLRQGQRIEVQLKLVRMTPEQERVIPYSFDKRPEYFVKGGLLFQHLSRPYLGLWKEWWRRGPLRLLIEHDLEGENPTPEHPRRVILSRVLADAVNLGYHDVGATMVDKVNGVAVRNLDDVRAALDGLIGKLDYLAQLGVTAVWVLPFYPSPLRDDVMRAVARVSVELWPNSVVTPEMSNGATDGLYLRNAGVPVYGVAGLVMAPEDDHSHGLDERVAVQALFDARTFWDRLVRALTAT